MLKIGQPAPDFTLLDQEGTSHTLSDYRGQWVLVYFYPKDDTPGCTKEACTIRDVYNDFEKLNVKVFGISADSVATHKKFATKYKLPFSLLADTDKHVAKAYSAKRFIGIKRISYLINTDGTITKVYPKVDPAGHAGELLQDIQNLSSSS